LDEWARIVKNIPGELVVPSIVPPPDHSEREIMHFSDNEWRVLSLINGYYNVASIASRSGIGRFETYRILNSFLASGLVAIRQDTLPKPAREVPDATPMIRLEGETAPNDAEKRKSSTGTSSARLMAMFALRKQNGEEPAGETQPRPRPHMRFASPVSFVAGLANALLEELVSNPDFCLGRDDFHLAEEHWRTIVMGYPKADLITAAENRIDAGKFDRYIECAGLAGPLRICYEEVLEALNRYLKVLFMLASQRLGSKVAQRVFISLFKDFRSRSTIANSEDFFFQDYAEKVYA
jgi:hypothetical protein